MKYMTLEYRSTLAISTNVCGINFENLISTNELFPNTHYYPSQYFLIWRNNFWKFQQLNKRIHLIIGVEPRTDALIRVLRFVWERERERERENQEGFKVFESADRSRIRFLSLRAALLWSRSCFFSGCVLGRVWIRPGRGGTGGGDGASCDVPGRG
jgi:hypothetical protein